MIKEQVSKLHMKHIQTTQQQQYKQEQQQNKQAQLIKQKQHCSSQNGLLRAQISSLNKYLWETKKHILKDSLSGHTMQ